MRRSSRLMPKFKSREMGPLGTFIILLLISSPVLWLMWQFPITTVAIPFILIVSYLLGRHDRDHFKQLSMERENESICTFSRSFNCREIDTWIVRAVYEEIYDYVKIPLRPTDHVFTDLKIDEDDFDLDIVESIAKRTGRSLKNYTTNPFYGKAGTLEGLVHFFNHEPKQVSA